jgi:hypothetical protein
MKTSQSSYGANPWNVDGSTTFYSYTDGTKLTCTEMISYGIAQDDGTYGRKLFYEARGYNVGDCFSQWTDYQHVDGFTLADFQVEINSGHPVFINLQGHSVVGFGYDGSTIYIRDTWDSNPDNIYSMTWGGSYAGMELHSVSIVQLSSNAVPGAFAKSSPANESIGISLSPTLSWSISFDANNYDYCYDTLDDGVCNTTWVDNGANTSVELSGLSPGMTYFWQVRAVNDIGTTFSEGSEAAFWEFTTGYPPGAFSKTSPTDGSINVPLSPTLTWTESSGADGYEYCLDTIDNDVCDTSWVENFTSTSVTLSGLSPGMTYFWQVRAVNEGGVAYADGEESGFWSFKTKYRLHLPIILKE